MMTYLRGAKWKLFRGLALVWRQLTLQECNFVVVTLQPLCTPLKSKNGFSYSYSYFLRWIYQIDCILSKSTVFYRNRFGIIALITCVLHRPHYNHLVHIVLYRRFFICFTFNNTRITNILNNTIPARTYSAGTGRCGVQRRPKNQVMVECPLGGWEGSWCLIPSTLALFFLML